MFPTKAFAQDFRERTSTGLIRMKTVTIEKLTVLASCGEQRSPVQELHTFSVGDLPEPRSSAKQLWVDAKQRLATSTTGSTTGARHG